jgi:hypothetical protein
MMIATETNIKMNFKEVLCQDVDWIDLAQNIEE